MALVNQTTGEVTVKLVYYGPPCAGKTANLRWLHEHVACRTKGKLVSLETEQDRALFFDFVPLAAGVADARHTRVQLYTVQGRLHRETTWRMVLKGCDGIVLVADSQAAMLDADVETMHEMQRTLLLSEVDPALPLVIQYNKRDLPTALSVAVLEKQLNPRGLQHFEAVAREGIGVEETLRGLLGLLSAWLARNRARAQATAPASERGSAALPAHAPASAIDARGPARVTPEPEAVPDGARLKPGEWLVLQHGAQQGPLSFDDVVDLVLAGGADETKVWRPGMRGWSSAASAEEIAAEIPPPLPLAPAPLGSQGDEDMPDFDTVPRVLRTVLIADEDASFRRFLSMPLAAQGFTIYEAADGAAAWHLAVAHRPWIILADVSMPELDGFEFCRRVRSHPLLSRKPLLFVSGSDKYRERYRALQTGADDFLSKNTPIRELLIRMQLLMTRYSDLGRPPVRDGDGLVAEGALDGRVEVFGAPALVQICHDRRLTGLLSVTSDAERRAGALGFRDGEIVSARVDALVGAEAVYALLSWEHGNFRFVPCDPGSGAPLASSLESLLEEGCRRIETARRGGAD